jgi:hypothetical protein
MSPAIRFIALDGCTRATGNNKPISIARNFIWHNLSRFGWAAGAQPYAGAQFNARHNRFATSPNCAPE